MPPEHYDLDLGHDHYLTFTRWAPDRELNPKYAGLPDVEKFGASVYHRTPDGKPCEGAIQFDGPVQQELYRRTVERVKAQGRKPLPYVAWAVSSWEPLTCTPSLLCGRCGDHGFIENGKWKAA